MEESWAGVWLIQNSLETTNHGKGLAPSIRFTKRSILTPGKYTAGTLREGAMARTCNRTVSFQSSSQPGIRLMAIPRFFCAAALASNTTVTLAPELAH